jgi:hypothetical protein
VPLKCNLINFIIFTDPHVRVAGRREEVKVAKDKVMEVLDTRVIILLVAMALTVCILMYVYRVEPLDQSCIIIKGIATYGKLWCEAASDTNVFGMSIEMPYYSNHSRTFKIYNIMQRKNSIFIQIVFLDL